MQISVGTLLLWGGLAGLAIFTLAGVICWLVLRRKGRGLLHAIEREYQ